MSRIKTISIGLILYFGLSGYTSDVKERVYLHPNTQVLLSGETLLFSAYTLSDLTGKVTDLSQILYVQLVGDKGPVFEEKIMLDEGMGNGSFFVNSLVPTGRYQLLAYTRWMRNFDDYFQLPITIINPFESDIPERIAKEELSIQFFTTRDTLVMGIENTVGYRISSGDQSTNRMSGKVLNAKGEVVQSFRSNEAGHGSFAITPDSKESYRVVMEDEKGQFSFHEFLPIADHGYRFKWDEHNDDLVLNIQSNHTSSRLLPLKIYYANQEWMSKEVVVNSPIVFPKSTVPEELFQFVVNDGQQETISRPILLSKPEGSELKISKLNKTYQKRSSVGVQIDLPLGSFSVSVRLKDSLMSELPIAAKHSRKSVMLKDLWSNRSLSPQFSSFVYTDIHQFKNPKALPDSIDFLPENTHELLQGVLKKPSGEVGVNREVTLSFPGKNPQIYTAITDEKGRMVFRYRPSRKDTELLLSVLDSDEQWIFEMEQKFMEEFPKFDYSIPRLDSIQALLIQERSINNQIVNAFSVDSDDSVVIEEPIPIFTQHDYDYKLDDYTRFPTLKDHLIEYVRAVGMKNEGMNVRIKHLKPDIFDKTSLILLDGVPVDPVRIMEINPYLLDRIQVISNRVYLGPSRFDGIVSLETYQGDLAGFEPAYVSKTPYQGVIPKSSEVQSGFKRISSKPDRRIQLYWDPSINWEGRSYQLELETSDVKGVYELRIEGFSAEGEPVSRVKTFEVL